MFLWIAAFVAAATAVVTPNGNDTLLANGNPNLSWAA